MPRTINSFSGSAGDNALVDKTLGRSYDVVKDVYLALPKLEALQQNPNINKLVDNFGKVDEILQHTDAIDDIGNNLTDILTSKMYSQVAQAQSEGAAESANRAADIAKTAEGTLTEIKQVKDVLDPFKADVEIVADNIKSVQTTSANIAQINHLSSVFTNDVTIPKIDAVLAELADIIKVSDNIQEIILVAQKFIGNGDVDKIEAASQDIKDNLIKYQQVLEDIKQEVIRAGFAVDQVQDKVNEGNIQLTAAITLGEVKLNSILKEGEDLLKYVREISSNVDLSIDEANSILLKMRSLYASYEQAIKTLTDKSVLKIQSAADHELLRIRKEAENVIDRIDSAVDVVTGDILNKLKNKAEEIKNQKIAETQTAIDQAASQRLAEFNLSLSSASQEKLDAFNSQADQVTQQKLAELQQKADELIKQIDAKLDEIKVDLTDITLRLTTVENKVKVLEGKIDNLPSQGNDTSGKDIRFGYVDYSLPQNQDKMEIGTTYVLAFDENKQYIQINPDTNAFAKDPSYIRLYMKSASGNVAYIEKQLTLDLSKYLRKDELKAASTELAGIVELATNEEVEQGTSTTTVITPKTLKETLSKVLIKQFESNPNGLMNITVQQIVKTIAKDRHLQEDLAESMLDEIKHGLNLDSPDEGKPIPPDGIIDQNMIFKGNVEFDGTVTVPSQSGDPSTWLYNVVLGKDDILKLIEQNKGNKIELLDSYPNSGDDLEQNVLYLAPLTGSVFELSVEGSEPTTKTKDNSIVAFDSTDVI